LRASSYLIEKLSNTNRIPKTQTGIFKNNRDMKKKWIRKIIGGLSFTTALFVFQACYGTPQDFGLDLLLEGQVKSKTTGLPIKGIKVSVMDNTQHTITSNDGRFSFYTEMMADMKILFEDIDSTLNGSFHNSDTLLTQPQERVFLNIKLEEK